MLNTFWSLLVLFVFAATAQDTTENNLDDAYLNATEIIRKYGYPVEEHRITSEDGYINTVFRIPYGKNGSNTNVSSGSVYLMHGLLSCSDAWLLRENESLAFLLADQGYDVWMANGRGSRYSKNHTTLDPDSAEYSDFSWHEQGVYDVPAAIDYILNKTGGNSLSYIGYSMGGTIYFVMATERPEYNAKLKMAINLAPACFMANMYNPILRALAPFTDVLAAAVSPLLHGAIPASPPPTPENTNVNSTVGLLLTILMQGLTAGFNPREADLERYQAQSRGSCGGTVRQIQHFGQEVNSRRFCQFDYGFLENLNKYGQFTAPDYNLTNVRGNVAVIYGTGDWIVSPLDLEHLCESLPDGIGQFIKVEEDGFQHSDFVIGKNSKPLVYDKIVALLRSDGFEGKTCPSASVASRSLSQTKNKNKGVVKSGSIRHRGQKSRSRGASPVQKSSRG